jgi:predicted nucleotidyltransferase component of viral defense system
MMPDMEKNLAEDTSTLFDIKNIARQIAQDIILCSLSKSGFFKKAVLHGDKARRLQFGLGGLPGHLECSLNEADTSFKISSLLPCIEQGLLGYGLKFRPEIREKTLEDNVQSMILRSNSREVVKTLFKMEKLAENISDTDMIKVKFELNVVPSKYAVTETKLMSFPEKYEIRMYDKASLFAEKINNTICRAWRGRTKGCDLLDYTFYLSNGVHYNHKHLVERLMDSNYVEAKPEMTFEEVKANLCYRFREINYEQSKIDLLPFIGNPELLDMWDPKYFCNITEDLKSV